MGKRKREKPTPSRPTSSFMPKRPKRPGERPGDGTPHLPDCLPREGAAKVNREKLRKLSEKFKRKLSEKFHPDMKWTDSTPCEPNDPPQKAVSAPFFLIKIKQPEPPVEESKIPT